MLKTDDKVEIVHFVGGGMSVQPGKIYPQISPITR